MLSDEERKAINQLKADTSFYDYELKNGNYIYELFKIEVYKKDIDVILNLIEKQSKEIEELKENNKLLQENYSLAHEDINWFCENYISKEESEQRERKAYIKGTNDADELCNKMWEDKIKAKIEEEDKLFFKTKDVRHANRYKAYKELLEKE